MLVFCYCSLLCFVVHSLSRIDIDIDPVFGLSVDPFARDRNWKNLKKQSETLRHSLFPQSVPSTLDSNEKLSVFVLSDGIRKTQSFPTHFIALHHRPDLIQIPICFIPNAHSVSILNIDSMLRIHEIALSLHDDI